MGRYLRYASDQHWPLEQEPVARLVTKARLQAYMAELFARNAPATVLHRIIGLERGMAVLAPKSNRALLRLVIADLEEHFDPVSKRERLQETAALVGLGFSLMADAEINQNKYRKRVAAQYRDGLMIAFLARRPIRLRNLSMMLIGQHVKPVGGFWRLRFERHEVKNNRPIDLLFPEDLVEPLERYLKDYRPILAGRRFAGQALWVSGQEQQLCPYLDPAATLRSDERRVQFANNAAPVPRLRSHVLGRACAGDRADRPSDPWQHVCRHGEAL